MPITIERSHEVNEDMIADWLITAFEGGSNYWISHIEYSDPELAYEASAQHENIAAYACPEYWVGGGCITIYVDEPGFEEKTINLETLAEAARKVRPVIFARLENGTYDADDADIVLQYAMFDEVVFG